MSNNEMMPGETMFEYLKRKKRTMLEGTLNRQAAVIDRKPLREVSANQSMDLDKTQRQQSRQNSTKLIKSIVKLSDSNSTTPKRVTFAEQEKRLPSRSFLKMISPIQRKSPGITETEKSVRKDVVSKKQSYAQNYTKKMLNQKINEMRDVIEGFIRTGKHLKQKSHFLFVDIKPFFRHVQNCDEAGIEKKTEEVKAKLKAFERLFKQFDYESSQRTIDSFYQFFSQHLNELEGFTKAEIQLNKSSLTTEIQAAKNREIDELAERNKQLQRELATLIKKHDRLEHNHEELRTTAENQIASLTKDNQIKISKLQSQILQLQQQINQKKEENQYLKEHLKKFEGEIKLMVFEKEKYQQDCLITITKVKSEQQQFLLNQIMVLKKQFNTDITQMAALNKLKEQQYLAKLREESQQSHKLRSHLESLLQRNAELQEAMPALKAQSIRFKKQNECLATDMHRINQQLYQHWLALKDIKTLSLRLDIFHKFKKIYEQLLFNEQLFL